MNMHNRKFCIPEIGDRYIENIQSNCPCYRPGAETGKILNYAVRSKSCREVKKRKIRWPMIAEEIMMAVLRVWSWTWLYRC